ncbi:unnamed protein product, partial [Prorocentrum cordatum]
PDWSCWCPSTELKPSPSWWFPGHFLFYIKELVVPLAEGEEEPLVHARSSIRRACLRTAAGAGAEPHDAGERGISASMPRIDRLQMKMQQSDDSETPSTGRLSSPGYAPQAELGALRERTATLEAQLLQCARAGQGLLAQNQDLQHQVGQLKEAQQLLQRHASELQEQLEEERQRPRSSRPSSRRQSRRWSRESLDDDASAVRGDLSRRASTATRKSAARTGSPSSGSDQSGSRPPPRMSTRSPAARRHGSVDSMQSSGGGEDGESRACEELRRQLHTVEDTNSELLAANTQLHDGMQRLERELHEARAQARAEAEAAQAEAARAAEAEQCGDEAPCALAPAPMGRGLARFKRTAWAVRFAVDTPSRAASRLRRASSSLSDSERRLRRTSSTGLDAPALGAALSEEDEESEEGAEEASKREADLEGQLRESVVRCEAAEREVGHLAARCAALEEERARAQELWREETVRSAALACEVEQLRAKLDEQDAEASALLMARHRRRSLAADLSGARPSLRAEADGEPPE